MRGLSLLSFFFLCTWPSGRPPDKALTFIDPTGTYILKGKVRQNNITGHFGELRVQLLDSQTVAFCFYLSSGYPDYAAAAILDTLPYDGDDNSIHYRPKTDSTCSLVLIFKPRSVELMKIFSDPGSGCGFAPNVIAPVTLPKISSEVPVIQDLSSRSRYGP
jgi:hypothetical protein